MSPLFHGDIVPSTMKVMGARSDLEEVNEPSRD